MERNVRRGIATEFERTYETPAVGKEKFMRKLRDMQRQTEKMERALKMGVKSCAFKPYTKERVYFKLVCKSTLWNDLPLDCWSLIDRFFVQQYTPCHMCDAKRVGPMYFEGFCSNECFNKL